MGRSRCLDRLRQVGDGIVRAEGCGCGRRSSGIRRLSILRRRRRLLFQLKWLQHAGSRWQSVGCCPQLRLPSHVRSWWRRTTWRRTRRWTRRRRPCRLLSWCWSCGLVPLSHLQCLRLDAGSQGHPCCECGCGHVVGTSRCASRRAPSVTAMLQVLLARATFPAALVVDVVLRTGSVPTFSTGRSAAGQQRNIMCSI